MLFAVIGLLFGVPVLWTVSVGALRHARRARGWDPRRGCQAWVVVPLMGDRRYRCAEPLYAGGPWCRRHEVVRSREGGDPGRPGPGARPIDEPQAVGRALAQARVGVPLAVFTTIAALAAAGWLLLGTG